MVNYGIKVSNKNKSVHGGIDDLLLHSDYPMFKYHGEYTASVVFNPGDITKTVSITHGLGYVPAFLSYGVRSDDGANFIIPSIPYAISEFHYAESWADTQKIYFRFTLFDNYNGTGWNQIKMYPSDWYNGYYGTTDSVEVGNENGTGFDGALRFTNIPLNKNQSISSAEISYYVGVKGKGTGDLKIKTYGIDEDNTGSFGYPLGREKTTVVTTQSVSLPPQGEYFGINIKSQVEEIISRTNWTNNNAIGFIFTNDNSPNDVYAYDHSSGTNSFINIKLPGTLTINFRTIVFKDKIA